ncbi:MAG: metal ABC transporter substrate-binding protein [Oscillospiraceae bacterium]|nr:metal ABC transporter substrate-binding protein [Oscillospiraceae bacterium]
MKKTLIFVLIFAIAAALCGCAGEPYESGGDGLEIVATLFPAYDFARNIAGERANVTLLVPPGSEAHSFEPTPQDVVRIQSCDLLVRNGGESEAWMDEVMEGQEDAVPTLTMLECVDAVEEEVKEGMQADEEEDSGGEELEYDEHEWTSPVNAALICRAIRDRLCEADPDGADYYTQNCEEYCAKLDGLDAAFREVVSGASRRTLIFADRFPVRYFVEEYGLDYYAAFPGCADDTEPSAKTVAFLIDKVREERVPAVMYIEFSNQKMADIICEDTGCKKLPFNSCHNVTAEQFKAGVGYLDLMWENVSSLEEALG